MRFAEEWRNMLEHTDNLDFYQDSVNGLIFNGDKIAGVKTVLLLRHILQKRFDYQLVKELIIKIIVFLK
jgi:tRNA U34 5-carboxymethylaminomethyl modifying enzyme MnmG/GidA